MPFDHPWVQRARDLAERAHAGQTRKDGETPYFAHLEAVARILAEHGYDDPVTLSAAYLHDVFEDQKEHEDAVRQQMPAEVVARVDALSESKTDADGRPRPKAQRFEDYVARLADGSDASRGALPISCADKIHNTSSLVEAERRGHRLLARLNTRPEEHGPHLARLRQLYAPVVNAALLASFDRSRDALLAVIERRRSLQIRLDPPSQEAVRAHARLPVVRGDHVTLVHGVNPDDFDPRWVPGRIEVGAAIELRSLHEHRDGRVQAWTVEVAGATVRPFDGGPLHITVSRAEGVRSREANRMIERTEGETRRMTLRGTVGWVVS